MAKKKPESEHSPDRIEALKLPAIESGVRILPVSHTEFEARWSLSQKALAAGLQAAAQTGDEPHLVLRAYSLSRDSDRSDFSEVWQDFRIDASENSAYLTLPSPTPRINCAIGLINKSGRFSPLVRGEAVSLPALPEASSGSPETAGDKSRKKEESPQLRTGYHTPPGQAQGQHDSADSLFEKSTNNWTGNEAVEMRAEFVISGKFAPGARLMLGNQILEPDSDGFVTWRRKLDSSRQIWPLLETALASPCVPAAPSLEFFRDVDSSAKIMELQAALRIEGKLNDPAHRHKLPEEIKVEADGVFKLTRMLPDGAIILPGLSLIASEQA